MYNSIISSAGVLVAILLPATNAAVLGARGHEETVTLSNCKNSNGVLSSQMGYYPGSPQFPTEQPTIATIQTGSTVVWEGNTVIGTFPDGNTFTSHIVSPKGPDQSYAGPANNKQGGFYCYHHAQASIYTDPQGNTCNMIYYCNHYAPPSSSPPPPPVTQPSAQGTVHFDFQIAGNYVTMPGHFTAQEMLSTIDQAVGDPYCDGSKSLPIGDGSCFISYTCHGDVPGQTTKGMATMLKSIVANTNGLVHYYSEKVKECTDTIPDPRPGQNPCIYTYVEQEYTQINNNLVMNVVYVPNGNPEGASDQGQMTYNVQCPAAANCNLCKGFQVGLEGAGVASMASPELSGLFAGASFITDALCALSGC